MVKLLCRNFSNYHEMGQIGENENQGWVVLHPPAGAAKNGIFTQCSRERQQVEHHRPEHPGGFASLGDII